VGPWRAGSVVQIIQSLSERLVPRPRDLLEVLFGLAFPRVVEHHCRLGHNDFDLPARPNPSTVKMTIRVVQTASFPPAEVHPLRWSLQNDCWALPPAAMGRRTHRPARIGPRRLAPHKPASFCILRASATIFLYRRASSVDPAPLAAPDRILVNQVPPDAQPPPRPRE